MLCFDLNCKELVDEKCIHFPQGYMEFVTRRGYCPFVHDGPNKIVAKDGPKRLVGQQKQKKKK